ncbi:MAG: hypothetical protein ACLQVG_24305 [Terriglobia bacterium]
MKWLLVCSIYLLMAASSVPGFARETGPRTVQSVLSEFTCPFGASPAACDSFLELARKEGNLHSYLALPLVLAKGKGYADTFVVFDELSDTFWVIFQLYAAKTGNTYWAYAEYRGGMLMTTDYETVTKGRPFGFAHPDRGIDVAVTKDGTIRARQAYTVGENDPAVTNLSISLATLKTTIAVSAGGRDIVEPFFTKAIWYNNRK